MLSTLKNVLLHVVVDWCIVLPLMVIRKVFTRYTARVHKNRQEKRLLNILNSTEDIHTWVSTAQRLDKLRGFDTWQVTDSVDGYYDVEGLRVRTVEIRALLKSKNSKAMGDYIRTELHRDVGGCCTPMLFRYYTGTKTVVEDYIAAVVMLIETFASSTNNDVSTPQSLTCDRTEFLHGSFWNTSKEPSQNASPHARTSPTTVALYNRVAIDWAFRSANTPEATTTRQERFALLKETAQAFGHTALLLSGGASLGMYHVGLVRALWEAKLLPRIMCGSSAGAIIASIFCSRTESEIRDMLAASLSTVALNAFEEKESVKEGIKGKVWRLLSTGAFMDVTVLQKCLRENLQDMTFLEAYKRTGRVLNVSIAAENRESSRTHKTVVMNYVTAPDVVIWSAVSASCAMPGLFTPVQLLYKCPSGTILPYSEHQLWMDGSVPCDLPMDRLSELFNVNYFIVSQTNPHVIPFLKNDISPLVHKQRTSLPKRVWFAMSAEFRYWTKKLFRFNIVPTEGALEVPYLMASQEYVGDLTIFPIGSVWSAIPDFINLTTNPTTEHMEYVGGNSMRRTWPHINQIRWVTEVERAIDRCLIASLDVGEGASLSSYDDSIRPSPKRPDSEVVGSR